jgi:hypothetical protein
MGIFDKIFGKGLQINPTENTDIEKVGPRAISKFYPILKPGNWVGVKNGAVRKTLIGTPEDPEVVIAFGYDAPSNFVFLMNEDLEKLNPDDVLKKAFANLEEYPAEFEPSTTLNGKILTCSGSDFCSEKILSRSFMMTGHELLSTEKILVSIPRRRCMMVTAVDADQPLLETFFYLHNHAWEDDSYGNPPIANMFFILEQGAITNVYKR